MSDEKVQEYVREYEDLMFNGTAEAKMAAYTLEQAVTKREQSLNDVITAEMEGAYYDSTSIQAATLLAAKALEENIRAYTELVGAEEELVNKNIRDIDSLTAAIDVTAENCPFIDDLKQALENEALYAVLDANVSGHRIDDINLSIKELADVSAELITISEKVIEAAHECRMDILHDKQAHTNAEIRPHPPNEMNYQRFLKEAAKRPELAGIDSFSIDTESGSKELQKAYKLFQDNLYTFDNKFQSQWAEMAAQERVSQSVKGMIFEGAKKLLSSIDKSDERRLGKLINNVAEALSPKIEKGLTDLMAAERSKIASSVNQSIAESQGLGKENMWFGASETTGSLDNLIKINDVGHEYEAKLNLGLITPEKAYDEVNKRLSFYKHYSEGYQPDGLLPIEHPEELTADNFGELGENADSFAHFEDLIIDAANNTAELVSKAFKETKNTFAKAAESFKEYVHDLAQTAKEMGDELKTAFKTYDFDKNTTEFIKCEDRKGKSIYGVSIQTNDGYRAEAIAIEGSKNNPPVVIYDKDNIPVPLSMNKLNDVQNDIKKALGESVKDYIEESQRALKAIGGGQYHFELEGAKAQPATQSAVRSIEREQTKKKESVGISY